MSARCLELVLAFTALAVPAAAQPELHGPVDPCSVAFVQDNTMTCEACPLEHGDPNACAAKFEPRGYVRKCRTGPHAPPSEVWCLLPAAPDAERGGKKMQAYSTLLGIVSAATVLVGAYMLWKQRRRAR